MSSRDERALLVKNLNLLRVWVGKTEWAQKLTIPIPKDAKKAKAVKKAVARRAAELKRSMQSYAQDLGDRCHYNLGWHDARAGLDMEEFRSTQSINSELVQLIEQIKRYGQPKRNVGNPNRKTVRSIDAQIWEKYTRDPQKRGLRHFVNQAVEKGDLPHRAEGSHDKRIQEAMTSWERSDDMDKFANGLLKDLDIRSGLKVKKGAKKKGVQIR